MKRHWLIGLLFFLAPLQVTAEVQRSVDEQGNVTFSDRPVEGSVKSESISINAPAPSSDSVAESLKESQATIDRANQVQQQQDSASQAKAQQSKSNAQSVESASAQLESAKIVGEGDRLGNAGGGSRLTPEYQNRVKAAEENLQRAQESAK
ncbi:MAG: DUF4124 domain-containing protein [Thiohalomonadales bacterium]